MGARWLRKHCGKKRLQKRISCNGRGCAYRQQSSRQYLFRNSFFKKEKFTSISDITFSAMERAAALFKKTIFVMDRGYDDNKMFPKPDSMGQDYVIRLTTKRKLPHHNKRVFAAELRSRRKGKVKLPLVHCFQGIPKLPRSQFA